MESENVTQKGTELAASPGAVYVIRTLRDIYELPTFEQMETCLDELAAGMKLARASADLMIDVTENITGKESVIKIEWPESFEWNDDGRGDVGARFTDPDGRELLSVDIKPNA